MYKHIQIQSDSERTSVLKQIESCSRNQPRCLLPSHSTLPRRTLRQRVREQTLIETTRKEWTLCQRNPCWSSYSLGGSRRRSQWSSRYPEPRALTFPPETGVWTGTAKCIALTISTRGPNPSIDRHPSSYLGPGVIR